MTVLELLAELKKDKDKQQSFVNEALLRERIVLGEQWQARDPLIESVVSEVHLVDGLVSENLLYPLVGTFSANVDKGRVEPSANPVHADDKDIEGARAAGEVLAYMKRKCDEPALIADAAFLAQCHGDVLFYPAWDEADGPHRVLQQKRDDIGPVIDIATGQPSMEEIKEYGGVTEEVIAAPSYWTSINDEYAKAAYVVVERNIDDHTARKRCKAAGFTDPTFSRATAKTPVDIEATGVEAYEIWHKPGARFEQGLFALVIGDYVCRAIPYPLNHGDLPGAVWKIGKVRGSPRGKTHVSDAIHQQRLVNKAIRDIVARSDVAADASLIGPGALISQMRASGRRRIKSDLPADKDPRWIVGEGIPESLFAFYDRSIAALHRVFGQSEATVSGGDPNDTQSGEQLKTASALDAQKIKGPRTALEYARLRVAKQKIELAIQYWDIARLVRVVGPNGEVNARYLLGSDLDGADISLEIGSGIMTSAIAGQRLAEEEGAAGLAQPADVMERKETGLRSTSAAAGSMAKIDQQAQAALRGQPQQPIAGVDAAAAVAHLSKVLASRAMDGAQMPALQGLIALMAAYQQVVSTASAQPAQQSNGAGQPAPAMAKPAGTKTTKMRESTAQPEGIS